MHASPTPRQTGEIIGRAIGYFELDLLLSGHSEDVLSAAGLSLRELRARYVALMIAAALHAIESANLAPEVEWEVARGVYDWASAQQDPPLQARLAHIEQTKASFAAAAADDETISTRAGDYSQIELEFFDQLIALGEATESRQRACIRLSAVLPKHLWPVHVASAMESLVRAGLVRT